MAKRIDQRAKDRRHKGYKLFFPETDEDRVVGFIRTISGTLRPGRFSIGGVPSVVFELWASPKGIEHRLKVPWNYAEYIIPQLRSLVPGIRVEDETEFPYRRWDKSAELGLTFTSRTLHIFSAAETSASLLASVQALEEGEAVLMQWVVTPAIPEHPPIHKHARTRGATVIMGDDATKDEVNDRRKKLEQPNFQAVLRVASAAKTDARAEHLMYRMRHSLASTRGPSTRFIKRIRTKAQIQKAIDEASTPLFFPMQLSAPELAALIAWPINNPFVSGLPAALSRQLPATENVPRVGRVIGRSNFPGNERDIAQPYAEAVKHTHVVGPIGSGKTALLANMMKQDMAQGYGVILIENKGDLFRAALDYVPAERIGDVIIFDVTDTAMPIGFNILNQGDPRVVIDELNQLVQHWYRESRSVWTPQVLFFGLRTLISQPGASFIDLGTFLTPSTPDEIAWSDDLRRQATDREVRNFWQRFENLGQADQDRFVRPLLDRIWQLNGRPEVRNIIGQSTSSFQMADVIKGNKILLVNLEGIAKDTASLTGTLLMNAIWHAVKSNRGPLMNFLYLDEFQDFVDLPVGPEEMLVKSRSFGLGITAAHQHLGQLPLELRGAILANAQTKVVFQTSADDARHMTREFGRTVTDLDFMHLGRFEALARVATPGGISAPVTLKTLAPAEPSGHAKQVYSLSRREYGRPIEDVYKSMDERYKPVPNPSKPRRKRPDIGSAS